MNSSKIELGKHHDGGFDYQVIIRGNLLKGWRTGTRDEVEAHAKTIAEVVEKRVEGLKYYNGRKR